MSVKKKINFSLATAARKNPKGENTGPFARIEILTICRRGACSAPAGKPKNIAEQQTLHIVCVWWRSFSI
jgi:hypothetical protein